jgi:hypothetical protein
MHAPHVHVLESHVRVPDVPQVCVVLGAHTAVEGCTHPDQERTPLLHVPVSVPQLPQLSVTVPPLAMG